jgi:hypothetical protein
LFFFYPLSARFSLVTAEIDYRLEVCLRFPAGTWLSLPAIKFSGGLGPPPSYQRVPEARSLEIKRTQHEDLNSFDCLSTQDG